MFRFTIRDVLWLTVVVGVGLALYLENRRAALWRARGGAAYQALDDLAIAAGVGRRWTCGASRFRRNGREMA